DLFSRLPVDQAGAGAAYRGSPRMIDIRGVSKRYGSVEVLKGCSTKVARGEVVVVCGPSGSGKSTFIKCINGLVPFDRGEILVGDFMLAPGIKRLAGLRRDVGMVFQHFELFPHLTVLGNVMLAQRKVLGRSKAEAAAKAEQ